MNLTIKRTKLEYFTLLVLIVPLAVTVTRIEWEDLRLIDFLNIGLLGFMIFSFVRFVVDPIWIQIKGEKVRINTTFFGNRKFNLAEVENVMESNGYSFKIEIHLKDKRIIKINSFDLSEVKKNALMEVIRNHNL